MNWTVDGVSIMPYALCQQLFTVPHNVTAVILLACVSIATLLQNMKMCPVAIWYR